jgi:hypothetical protein
VRGSLGRLRSDLHHFTCETIERQVKKILPYTSDFARDHAMVPAGLPTLLFRPAWRFFRGYLLRLGFLDGWQGLYIAWMSAFAVATKYARVREAREQRKMKGNDAPAHEPNQL